MSNPWPQLVCKLTKTDEQPNSAGRLGDLFFRRLAEPAALAAAPCRSSEDELSRSSVGVLGCRFGPSEALPGVNSDQVHRELDSSDRRRRNQQCPIT